MGIFKKHKQRQEIYTSMKMKPIDLSLTRIEFDFIRGQTWTIPLSAEENRKLKIMYDSSDAELQDSAWAIIAWRLIARYGKLTEVRCLQGPVPQRIELLYEDGHGLVVTKRSGNRDISIISFGYTGDGPSCFYLFLKASGFNITEETVTKIKAPCILRR